MITRPFALNINIISYPCNIMADASNHNPLMSCFKSCNQYCFFSGGSDEQPDKLTYPAISLTFAEKYQFRHCQTMHSHSCPWLEVSAF